MGLNPCRLGFAVCMSLTFATVDMDGWGPNICVNEREDSQTAGFCGHFHLKLCTQMVANGGMGCPYIDGPSGTCHHSPHNGFYFWTPPWKDAEDRGNSSLRPFSSDAANRKNLHVLLGPSRWYDLSWAGLRMSCSCQLYTWLVARKCQSETCETGNGVWYFTARLHEMWYTAIGSMGIDGITWRSGSYKGRTSVRRPIGLGLLT